MMTFKVGDLVIYREGEFRMPARVERATDAYAWVLGCAFRQGDGYERGAPRRAAYQCKVPWRSIRRPRPKETAHLDLRKRIQLARAAMWGLLDDSEGERKCREIMAVLGL